MWRGIGQGEHGRKVQQGKKCSALHSLEGTMELLEPEVPPSDLRLKEVDVAPMWMEDGHQGQKV